MWGVGRRQSAGERIVASMLLTILLAAFEGNAAGAQEPAPVSFPSSSSSANSKAADGDGQVASPSQEPLRVPRPSGHRLATWLGRGFPGVGATWARLERVVARFGGNHAGNGGLRGDLRRGPQVLAPEVRGIVTGRRPRQPLVQALDLPGAGRRAGPADRHRQSRRPQSARRVDRGGTRLDSADPARRRPYSPDARTARPFEVTSTRATPSLDIHLGDDQ